MEIKNVKSLEEFNKNKAVRKVPVMTDDLSIALLFIDSNTEMPALFHKKIEKVHYIIKGEGKLNIGKESKKVKDGMLIRIPKNKLYYYTTFTKRMVILSIGPIGTNNSMISALDVDALMDRGVRRDQGLGDPEGDVYDKVG